MKRVEDPELFDPHSANGHVTLYDGRGHVLGYVDPVTRIQTDIHGRAVRRVPVSGRASHGARDSRRPRLANGEPDGRS
jgi:hypothetical protein